MKLLNKTYRTLRNIAEEFKIPYNTLLHYKQVTNGNIAVAFVFAVSKSNKPSKLKYKEQDNHLHQTQNVLVLADVVALSLNIEGESVVLKEMIPLIMTHLK